MVVPDSVVLLVVVVSCTIGLLFATMKMLKVSQVKVDEYSFGDQTAQRKKITRDLKDISGYISEGAESFLNQEFTIMGYFIVMFGALLFVVLGALHDYAAAAWTVVSFVVGSLTSMAAGYIGMRVAVYANSRVAFAAWTQTSETKRYESSFTLAFEAGAVMGFTLTCLGVIVLFALIYVVHSYYNQALVDPTMTKVMYECIAGYGLGGSSIALFGRVGGGIYTKAADVGADLCKINYDMNEDSPHNPAVIADNVGDNVGDVAGMGADLFGSFAESSCATMVIAAQSPELFSCWPAMCFPLVVSSTGIICCFVTAFFATHIWKVQTKHDIQPVLKQQLIISTVLTTAGVLAASMFFLPDTFALHDKPNCSNFAVFWCIACGLWSGLAIGVITEYYTSNAYAPTKEVAVSCRTGAAANIIYGLALGYQSVIIPIFCLAATIYVSYSLAGMFGIANAALGILSTMCTGLTIDVYGPICDNAGGLAEMCEMPHQVRECTDLLDAAGNTTAAIGKGFAIGSAALVSLALFGAFVTTVNLATVDILQPFQFAGLLIGAMLPYWFSAMTMKSVGMAAEEMTVEVKRQFEEKPNGHLLLDACFAADKLAEATKKLENAIEADEKAKEAATDAADAAKRDATGDAKEAAPADDAKESDAVVEARAEREKAVAYMDKFEGVRPDYAKCVAISTQASLSMMVAPGALVMLTPIIVGFVFGVECLAGVLAGSLTSGVQVAISMSNTGGAWDNAKKYVESGQMVPINKETAKDVGKGSKIHVASVIGDTVGDPLKDTSGPALNILIKLSAIISLVFAPAFFTTEQGGFLTQFLHHIQWS